MSKNELKLKNFGLGNYISSRSNFVGRQKEYDSDLVLQTLMEELVALLKAEKPNVERTMELYQYIWIIWDSNAKKGLEVIPTNLTNPWSKK